MKTLTQLSTKFENSCQKAKEIILSLKDVERAKNKKYEEHGFVDEQDFINDKKALCQEYL